MQGELTRAVTRHPYAQRPEEHGEPRHHHLTGNVGDGLHGLGLQVANVPWSQAGQQEQHLCRTVMQSVGGEGVDLPDYRLHSTTLVWLSE